MRRLALFAAAMYGVLLIVSVPAGAAEDYQQRLTRVLLASPLIDGHNDLPWEIRDRYKSQFTQLDLRADTSHLKVQPDQAELMTDIPRLRAGMVGGQFWSVWIPASTIGFEAVQMTLEQIDVVKRMAEAYPDDFSMAYSAADIRRIHKTHKIASLIGVEGGHQINDSLAVLRQYYDAGARYMTLTHTSNTAWADSATDAPKHSGLTAFGVEVVKEMNRLGMLVDLSHVSPDTMRAALAASAAPVIYSHSSARALNDHPRNVPDDILASVAANGGTVMVTFAPSYVSAARAQWDADYAAEVARNNSPPYDGLYIGQPERAKAALAAWQSQHPRPAATLGEVADHVEHIAKIAGVDHVGLGSDFDGIEDAPTGLAGVDRFPALLEELMRRGWTDRDIAKLAGENLLRVMGAAEQVSVRLRVTRAASNATLQSKQHTSP
jgi:membrane dipeptidase